MIIDAECALVMNTAESREGGPKSGRGPGQGDSKHAEATQATESVRKLYEAQVAERKFGHGRTYQSAKQGCEMSQNALGSYIATRDVTTKVRKTD